MMDHKNICPGATGHAKSGVVPPHVHPHGLEHEQGHHHTQTKSILNRLSRITGHIEAVKRMVEQERDCSEILIQLAAVDSAVMSVSRVILKDHIDHCIVDAVHNNDMSAVEDLKKAMETFIK